MPAPTIDTQGPLVRRKALISKLMAQLQGGGASSPPSVPKTRSGNPIPSGAGAMAIRPGNLESRSSLVSGLIGGGPPPQVPGPVAAPAPVAAPLPTPAALPTPEAAFEPPAAPAQWQNEGFLSQELFDSFNRLSDYERERIQLSPHLRRRYYG